MKTLMIISLPILMSFNGIEIKSYGGTLHYIVPNFACELTIRKCKDALEKKYQDACKEAQKNTNNYKWKE